MDNCLNPLWCIIRSGNSNVLGDGVVIEVSVREGYLCHFTVVGIEARYRGI
jgi:hypothetical protein